MKKSKRQKADKQQQTVKESPAKARASAATKKLTMILLGICLLLTAFAYIPSLKGEFVNWDDDDYAVNNELIRSFSHTKELLTVPVQGNFHPLTMLSLALNYAISGSNTTSYHVLNLLLHLLNTVLVFFFVRRLVGNQIIIPYAAALLFGVHPMHVESVAWISERKDVLYTFFFLLGLISYLKYTDSKSRSAYILSVVLFLLSLASKPAAIIFPVALFTIDFYRSRKLSLQLFLEKIPYVIFSALITYLTIHAQKSAGATDTIAAFTLTNRIFFVFYGYMMYVFKMLIPLNLCAFYPLPPINESLPVEYFLSPIFFILTVVVSFLMRKKYPVIAFGFGFYFVNLMLVLQFMVIGSAIIAERYTYVPYIGLFIIIGWMVDRYLQAKQSTALAVLTIVGVLLTVLSYQQSATWKNSAALWDNAIVKVPSERAYVNRATLLRKEGKLDKALAYYNEAMHLNKVDHEAYCNRANIYFDKGMDSLALADYNEALSLKPDFVPALDNRGALLARAGKSELALVDLNKAIQLNPDYKSAYANRAITLFDLKQYQNAINDFEKYISYYPNDVDNRNSIGVCYQMMGRQDLAIKPFTECININPKPTFYLNRSYCYNALGKLEEARADATKALQGGLKVPDNYLHRIGLK